ncbi:MAG: hypothetical protein PHW96_01750 [Candidatus Nanoarchaeia archaeon]|nr:hypothetical protein [Candidatus Nanoarchaeia archaeon]
MDLEEFTEKGYGISEVHGHKGDILMNVTEEFIEGLVKRFHKVYPETEIRKKLEVERIIVPSQNGKRIVFASEWNKQCHLSSLFLDGDFYLALDGHTDFLSGCNGRGMFGIYDCANYRRFIAEKWLKNNKKLILLTTATESEFENHTKELKCLTEGIAYIRIFRSSTPNLDELIKGKKGVVCLDYDIMCPEDVKRFRLDTTFNKLGGIGFNDLSRIMKDILEKADVLTLFVTIPYISRNFLEELL